jgi:hypothetical protein
VSVVGFYITCPPFGLMTCPTIKFASSDARYATRDAISQGLPSLPIGISDSISFSISSVMPPFVSRGVSMYPGATALMP